MRLDLVTKYDLRVPRYTSYPTAPHFGPMIGPDAYAGWLTGMDRSTPLSLYAHIPYCAKQCLFCGCHTRITSQYDAIAGYLRHLWREIGMVADRLPTRMDVRHIHFGGGSPTILKPEDFAATMALLRERFALSPQAEIAVELDPRTTSRAFVSAMAQAGISRVSIGVQDFNPVVQQAVNRVQPFATVERLIGWLREDGIGDINLDLIYGLPYQTAESLIDTLAQTVTLKPSRIALFGYAHVPWMKPHQQELPNSALPDMTERWRQYETVGRCLTETHGYARIGLDHFALPSDPLAGALAAGRLHRNFQGYTTDAAPVLLGFGASAIGSLPQGYAANAVGIEEYQERISQSLLATTRGIALSGDDRLRGALIERLMCNMALDIEAVCRQFDADPALFDADLDRLEPMEKDGLLVRQGRTVRITDAGHPLVRAACSVFDRYLDQGEARHSKAI